MNVVERILANGCTIKKAIFTKRSLINRSRVILTTTTLFLCRGSGMCPELAYS